MQSHLLHLLFGYSSLSFFSVSLILSKVCNLRESLLFPWSCLILLSCVGIELLKSIKETFPFDMISEMKIRGTLSVRIIKDKICNNNNVKISTEPQMCLKP
eukprot:TRINITY_DN37701_c0_g1_i1.p1 TRINITY_DN37701_c0_g1~~TRINITY_DN37701_c0_g1_i1.p1  ORF type:complete len:101 (-),score=9.23 TRINITY_DN37701_c0_g1_i1:297-599(-)